MQTEIHPTFRLAVYKDITCDFQFIAGTTMNPEKFDGTVEVDGTEYPLIKIDISSASHPFFTGKQKLMDTEGRVSRFMKKYGLAAPAEETADEAPAAE